MDCGKLRRIARCTLAVGVLALAFGASTASAGALETGFLDPGAISRGGEFRLPDAVAAERTVEAGGKIIRLYLYWNRVVPSQSSEPNQATNPASYNWNQGGGLDDAVDAARAQDLQVMLTIRSAPNFAQRGTPNSRGSQDPSPAMLERFTQAAVAQFDTRVDLWGVWNEPNLKSFLQPQYRKGKLVSPDLYRNLLAAAAPAIHAGDNNQVIAGETAPFHFVFDGKPANPGPLLFLRQLLCMSKGSHPTKTCDRNIQADIIATHPYTSGDVRHHAARSDDVSFGDLPEWKRLVKAAAQKGQFYRSGIDLWISEFSWDTKPPDPDAVPTRLHVRWTAEALYRTWQLGIDTLLWGQMRDYPVGNDPTYGQYQSGLYYCDDPPKSNCQVPFDLPSSQTAKPSLRAFRFPFVAYDSNGHIRIWGRTPESDAQALVIERKTSSGWKKMTNVTSAGNGIFSKRFSSSVKHGLVRARFGIGPGERISARFSLDRPADRFVNPFGCGGAIPCS